MQEKSIVLKRDARGRVRTPVEQRLAVVVEFESSGLSGSQFAKLTGIKYPTLMAWVAGKRRQASGGNEGSAPLFVEAVTSVAIAPAAVLVVEFAGARAHVLRYSPRVWLVETPLTAGLKYTTPSVLANAARPTAGEGLCAALLAPAESMGLRSSRTHILRRKTQGLAR